MNADRRTSPLARVRWANVVRLLALPAVVLIVACWPRLSSPAPRLPDATARPITIPAAPPAPHAPAARHAIPRGRASGRADHPHPLTAPRRRRPAARPSSAPRPRPPVPSPARRAVPPALATLPPEFDLESG
jgi:hypothetical protein